MTDFASRYQNWAQNVDFRPREIAKPRSAADISAFVMQANADDRRVRVLGSGWSFSDVATSHDYLISMGLLSRVLAFSYRGNRWGHARQTPERQSQLGTKHPPDSPVLLAALRPQLLDMDRRFAHVLGGMMVKELYLALDSPDWDTDEQSELINTRGRWALPTMGGSAGQAIAGVVSTSTHGADFDRPPIQEMVRAIDLIAPDGTRHWFERAGSNAITDPNKLASVFASDPLPLTQSHYDDGEFFSVLVSMGCMGVIHSLVLEVVPQFGLSQRVGTSSWNLIRASLANNGTFFTTLPTWSGVSGMDAHPSSVTTQRVPPVVVSANPVAHALEVFVNPYRISDDYFNDPMPDRKCIVVSRARSDEIVGDPLPEPLGGPSDVDLSMAILAFESGGPGTAKNIVDGVMSGTRTKTETPYPVAWSVMDTYGKPLPIVSIEIAIPTLGDKHLALIDDMLDRFDKQIQKQDGSKLAGALSLRFTKPSEALLAIQHFPGYSPERPVRICHIEVFCAQELRSITGGVEKHYSEDGRGLKNLNELEGNGEAFLRDFEELAEKYGAHLHWGQLSLTNRHSPQKYLDFPSWQKVRDQLTGGGAMRSFDNDFTVRYGISPGAQNWSPLSASLLPGSPTVAFADARVASRFPPTAFRNKEGCLEVVVIGSDGHVCWDRQGGPGAPFLGWSFVELPREGSDLGRNFGGRCAVGINRGDAHPEVFARDLVSRKIFHSWRDVKTTKWGGWTELDGSHRFEGSPDVLPAADGHLLLVARRDDEQILWRSQKEELGVVGWHSWLNLPSSPGGITFAGDPCLGQNLDQRLEVFTCDTNGFVWQSRQTDAKSDSAWSGWARVGVSAVGGDPAVGRRSDGRLEVFAASGGTGLAHIIQTAPNSGYGQDWSLVAAFDQPLDPNGRPAVILSRKNLQVAVRVADGRIIHFDQNSDNWQLFDLGGRLSSYPAIAENYDQRLEVFSKFANDFVEHRWQGATLTWPP